MKPKYQRRMEAVARQEEYDKLTKAQKIAMLDKRGFRALKQRKKLS